MKFITAVRDLVVIEKILSHCGLMPRPPPIAIASKCRECGGEMRVIASIIRVDVIQKILAHLGLSPQPSPVAPARSRQLFIV